MSPEQVTGRLVDDKSDVFTLSAVLAEMLCGEPLFGLGEDLDILLRIRDADLSVLESTGRRLPRDVVDLVRAGLNPRRETRLNASDFIRALDDITRKRGIARGPERLSRLLERLRLVKGRSRKPSLGPLPTELFDTTGVSTAAVVSGRDSPDAFRIEGQPEPLSFAQMIAMISTGRVGRTTLVAKGASEFRASPDWPELESFVRSPALRWDTDDLSQATLYGSLDSASLLPIAHEISHTGHTGALYLVDKGRRKKIYFVDGKPDFVASTDPNELLGEYLVRTERCLPMEVEMGLALLPKYGGRLGDALASLGVLRPVELARAVSDRVRSSYLEAFRWRTGTYAFVADAKSQEETFPFGHDEAELLRDAALEAHPAELLRALSPHQERVLHVSNNPPIPHRRFRAGAILGTIASGGREANSQRAGRARGGSRGNGHR